MLEQTKRTIETMKKAGFARSEFQARCPKDKNGEYASVQIIVWAKFNPEKHSIKILVEGGLSVTKSIFDDFTSYWVTYGFGGRYVIDDYREKDEYGLPKRTVAHEYSQQEASEVEASEAGQVYLDEIAEVLADTEYFDTPLKKASRVAVLVKSWGAITVYHGKLQYCAECGERFKHEDLYSAGYTHSRLMCETCNEAPDPCERESSVYGMSNLVADFVANKRQR